MPDARSQIAFEELGLGSLLKRYQLRVPPNQREYAWEDRQITQLFQDFGRAVNETGPYFLGTIVTLPRNGVGSLEVVDGQQRLATTAILLAAIRDHLRERGEDLLVQSINDEFLSGIDRERRDRVPKLTLNLDDNELFKQIVTNEAGDPLPKSGRASHERLLLARSEARKQVERIVALVGEREQGDQLNRWVSFIEHRALVVLLRVPDDADAYKMFETLNDRGLRTSQADLIKNFLFSRSGERFDEVQSRWSYMRGALESASDDPDITINFLRHALILQKGHVLGAEVYEKVQEIVKSEPAAVTFAATLETLANVYVATFNSNHEKWNGYPAASRRALDVLNLLDIKPIRPLILAVGAKLDPEEATQAFNFLIALGVRLMIASSTRSASVEEPLADAARDVFLGKLDTARMLRDELAKLTPKDTAFRTEFERAKVSNARLARYYLRSLEMTAKGEAEPWFVPQDDQQVINLEHVLPKKPEDNWPQFTEDEVGQYATRLGNQALLRASDNSNLKSQTFADKKPIYEASPYILTSQIGEVEEWTPQAIEERQKKLADLAVKTWTTSV
jgi:hypothetical protein